MSPKFSFTLPVYTRNKNLTACSKSVNKPLTSCVRIACPKLSSGSKQLVTSLREITDLLQGRSNDSDTNLL